MAYFIEYYYTKFDIQTAAMLSCILMRANDNVKHKTAVENTEHEVKTSLKKMAAFDNFCPLFKFAAKKNDNSSEQVILHHKINKLNLKRSQTELNYSDHSNNSNPNSPEHRKNYFPSEDNQTKGSDTSNSNLQLDKCYDTCLKLADQAQEDQFGLNSALKEHLDQICLEYATMLWQWGCLNQRGELLKCIKSDSQDVELKQVDDCSIVCMVCDQYCKGLVTVCKMCSHGGHVEHLTEYFGVFYFCPICGCRCRN